MANFTIIHCIDLKMVFLELKEHFTHFRLKICGLAKKSALLTTLSNSSLKLSKLIYESSTPVHV